MATFPFDAPLPPELDASASPCWSFNPEELTPRSSWRLLGEGSFGCVFLARWLGTPVAVKLNANEKANRYEGLLRDIKYLRCVVPEAKGAPAQRKPVLSLGGRSLLYAVAAPTRTRT